MIARMQVYKCGLCGNVVEVMHAGGGTLVCCGEPMGQLAENTVDASKEKHVPVLAKVAGGWKVSVGSVPHPMEEKHWIAWVELIDGDHVQRRFLSPGGKPEAVFAGTTGQPAAREFCNLHGLWKA